MATLNLDIAHITAADGATFQVLKEAADPVTGEVRLDWDEEATRALYDAYLAGQSPPA